MKKLLVVGLAFGALSAPAVAADLPVKAAPPPVVVSTWTGCYIGGSVGGAWAKSDWTYRNVNPYSSFGPAGPIVPGAMLSRCRAGSLAFKVDAIMNSKTVG
jgi:opacity protein-like surface antigen